MQTIVAFFLRYKTPEEYITRDETSENSFKRFATIAASRGIDLRFVLGEDSFKEGMFMNYWVLDNGNFIQRDESFRPTIIYAKQQSALLNNSKRVNNLYLETICIDKLLTAETFPKFVKETLLIDENTLENADKLNTDTVVLKPRTGSDGVNVSVLPKTQITKDMVKNVPYIVQELIDSSGGIKNLVDGRHEMRIYVFNNVIHSAYLRIPAKDSYLCNVAQGAKEMQITLDQIPESFISVVSEVNKAFKDTDPRHYTVDIMDEHGTPWIVELNNTPGLPAIHVQPLTDNYFNALLNLLTGKEIEGITLD